MMMTLKPTMGNPINRINSIDNFYLLKVSECLKSAIQTNQYPMIIEGERPDWMDKPPIGYDDVSLKTDNHKIDEALRFVIRYFGDLGIP